VERLKDQFTKKIPPLILERKYKRSIFNFGRYVKSAAVMK
jgi:hypothetical protein